MDKLLQFIGMSKRAGRLAQGEDMALDAVEKHHARVLLLAHDTADSTARKARNAGGDKVPVLILPCTKLELGAALGRDTCSIAAVTDMGFAAKIATMTAELDAAQAPTAERVLRKQEKIARRKVKKPRKKA